MNALRLFLLACVTTMLPAADAAGAASSNTVVRFRLGHGTTRLGDIDVELFDHDKPITVSNFLYYVRSGAFDRSILHRCVPGFIIQGGLYRVENPYAPVLFEAMARIEEGPSITNEFNVGRRVGNTFGTLAMALSSTNVGGIDYPLPNSATTSWYFNAADNSAQLDPNYTVFGRVVAGTSFLRSFNELAENKGIINMFGFGYPNSICDYPDLSGEGQVGLEALPVSYRFFDCPYYNRLFNVQIFALNRLDVAAPTITITSPAPNDSVVNEPLMVNGTAADSTGVTQVRVYLGTGAPVVAHLNTTSNTWSATLTNVPVGTNVLLVEATDASGNRSTVTHEFFRSVQMPIDLFLGGSSCVDVLVATNSIPVVMTSCGGTIEGATNGQLLELGRGYRLTAKAAPGNFFAGWYLWGWLVSPSPTYSFIMSTYVRLTAVFHTNLFPQVKGTYTGLFCNPEQVEESSSGFFTLTVGDLGSYSARVTIDGRSYPMTGTFDAATGLSLNFLKRPGSNEVFTVRLSLDLVGGRGHISGILSNSYVGHIGRMSWTAELHAYRHTFNSANPTPWAGKHTLIIPADPNSTAGPFGYGYGTATVNTKGSLTFTGALPDGTKVSQKVSVSKNGDWPLYLNLYKGSGTFLSRIVFDTNAPRTDLSGLANWFKRTQTATYYGGGFTNESIIVGSRFTPPAGSNRLLELTTGVVGFTNGNLVIDFANDVTLDASGKVTNLDDNQLNLRISRSSGLMSGLVMPPFGEVVSFKGAVLQKQTNGFGFFLGTSASGRVSLGRK